MRTTLSLSSLLLALVINSAQAQSHAATLGAAPEFKWGPAPAVFPAGAEMAVLHGDPSSNAEFTVRLRFPNKYRIAPHTHPTDENVTVISGTFRVGMGKTFAEKDMITLGTGGFVTAPANEAHFAEAQGVTVVQVHAIGPFVLTYVNPADMPHPTPGK